MKGAAEVEEWRGRLVGTDSSVPSLRCFCIVFLFGRNSGLCCCCCAGLAAAAAMAPPLLTPAAPAAPAGGMMLLEGENEILAVDVGDWTGSLLLLLLLFLLARAEGLLKGGSESLYPSPPTPLEPLLFTPGTCRELPMVLLGSGDEPGKAREKIIARM